MKSKLRLKSDYRSQKINIIFAARRVVSSVGLVRRLADDRVEVTGSLIYWVVSSVGLEHYLDRVGVTGSNPVQPTIRFAAKFNSGDVHSSELL